VVSHIYSPLALEAAGVEGLRWHKMARSTGDVPNDVSKLTVPKAAQALGISPEAVRNRLSRATLDSVKEDGTVYVLLYADRPQYIDDTPTDTAVESNVIISAKDETIRALEEQLESERAASAELRRIVAGLVQRVPELEPAREPRQSDVGASERTEEGDATPKGEKPVSGWRKLIFG